ncbi:acylphosphatase [Candidatus Woesebacteria bacterium RIFCSPLOWO2_01_FULL_39_21]|uniref:acylphosphatase n=1 Tax=Candidatus Woesebacteria bacterium RIFCSPLOWO2_01_FULL_39_21 TaxID=1802519 RepID=A0A1F8BEJ7_9BACT|nr:MAG: acylphosphatase [Candidatus Woesebacteria bacterium RIFCSPHIGHO2_01_FULL_39_23]OGM62462.1 MAG: acylphosphatase [Candidatus Woesebacteria bacterium RIFCSPLOWO2_01_FULL_39_21]
MVNVRAHLFIQGRVQAVSYRFWTQRSAQSLEFTGWIKNLDDGRVEAVFEGPKEKVEEMVEKCKKGPRFSNVEHIDVIWEKATGEFEEFEITS